MMTTQTSHFDPVNDKVLEAVARTGRAYTGEAKAMARELQQLRAERQTQTAATTVGYPRGLSLAP